MELLIIVFVSLAAAFLNSAHVILQWIANKPGEIFTGIAHSFADYFLYVGIMAQGAAGRWIWSEHLFSNEPMEPTWYYWFYVTLGHLGSFVGLSPFATYNISLFVFIIALCLVWYRLAKLLYPNDIFLRLITWLFILTTTNFASFARPGLAKLDISQVKLLGQFWFSPAPVFNRLGGVPYHAVQMILFILLAIIVSRFMASKTLPRNDSSSHDNMLARFRNKRFYSLISLVIGHWSLVILGTLAFFAGSANPVQMLLFGGSAILMISLMPHVPMQRKISTITILFLAGGVGAWMTNQEFAVQSVFLAARTWELSQQAPNHISVLLPSIGPVLLFVPFAVQKVFREKDPLLVLLITWGLLSFLLFLTPIPRMLELSPVRFLHPVPYAAALAILGAEGMVALSGLLHRRLKNNVTLTTIRLALVALYLILTIPVIAREFTDRITPARNPQLLMDTIYNHVPAPIVEALAWLRVTGSNPVMERFVVLTDPNIPIEVLIPVFTGMISFSGHPIHTLYLDVKEAKRQEFFGGKMNPAAAKQFLNDHLIGYILTTPTRGLSLMTSLNLHQIFKNTAIAIYKSPNE